MYNLLIGATRGAVGGDRLLEYTTDDIRQYIAPGATSRNVHGEVRTDRLLNLPTLLMPEIGSGDAEHQIARVGHVASVIKNGNDYTFTFVPNPAIAPIPSEQIKASASQFGIIHDFEFSRTHWAVKDVDLYRILDEEILAGVPKPKIFNFPTDEPRDPGLVAVMMPFRADFTLVYNSLKAGIDATGMSRLRADDIWEHDKVLDDVLSLIWRSRVVIADLSGKNPNVFYEVGIAHTLGRDTILVAQNLEDVPFDLRAIRTLSYLNNGEGREKLAEGITSRLRTIAEVRS